MASPDTNLVVKSFREAKCNGTVRQELKDLLAQLYGEDDAIAGFGRSVLQNLLMREMYLHRKEEEPHKWEAKTIAETTVTPDILNVGKVMHGGCTSFLIDSCSSFALSLLAAHMGKYPLMLSQSLNIVFHAPAPSGVKLKIISSTIAISSRVISARCEIFDITNARLIASGVHTKMEYVQRSESRM